MKILNEMGNWFGRQAASTSQAMIQVGRNSNATTQKGLHQTAQASNATGRQIAKLPDAAIHSSQMATAKSIGLWASIKRGMEKVSHIFQRGSLTLADKAQQGTKASQQATHQTAHQSQQATQLTNVSDPVRRQVTAQATSLVVHVVEQQMQQSSQAASHRAREMSHQSREGTEIAKETATQTGVQVARSAQRASDASDQARQVATHATIAAGQNTHHTATQMGPDNTFSQTGDEVARQAILTGHHSSLMGKHTHHTATQMGPDNTFSQTGDEVARQAVITGYEASRTGQNFHRIATQSGPENTFSQTGDEVARQAVIMGHESSRMSAAAEDASISVSERTSDLIDSTTETATKTGPQNIVTQGSRSATLQATLTGTTLKDSARLASLEAQEATAATRVSTTQAWERVSADDGRGVASSGTHTGIAGGGGKPELATLDAVDALISPRKTQLMADILEALVSMQAGMEDVVFGPTLQELVSLIHALQTGGNMQSKMRALENLVVTTVTKRKMGLEQAQQRLIARIQREL